MEVRFARTKLWVAQEVEIPQAAERCEKNAQPRRKKNLGLGQVAVPILVPLALSYANVSKRARSWQEAAEEQSRRGSWSEVAAESSCQKLVEERCSEP